MLIVVNNLETIVVPRQLSIHRQMSPRSYSVDSDDLRTRMKALGIRNRTVEALPEEGSEDNGIKKPRIHGMNYPKVTCLCRFNAIILRSIYLP